MIAGHKLANLPDHNLNFLLRLKLIRSDAVLFWLALPVCLSFFPYYTITHDSLLYAASTLISQYPQNFSNDLYLSFRLKQEQTLFLYLTRWLCNYLQIEVVFYLLFLFSRILFLWATIKFLKQITGEPLSLIISLLVVNLLPFTYGGYDILSVNEPFVSARSFGVAFSLLALGLFSDSSKKSYTWIISLILGLAFHPLMSAPALAVISLLLSLKNQKIFKLMLFCIVFALLALFLVPFQSLGFSVLAGDWLELTRSFSPLLFPSLWPAEDWLSVLFMISLYPAYFLLSKDFSNKFLFATWLVGCLGLIANVAAELQLCGIFLQLQFFRSLWLLSILQLPLIFKIYQSCADKQKPGLRSLVVFLSVTALLLLNNYQLDLTTFAGLISLYLGLVFIQWKLSQSKSLQEVESWSLCFLPHICLTYLGLLALARVVFQLDSLIISGGEAYLILVYTLHPILLLSMSILAVSTLQTLLKKSVLLGSFIAGACLLQVFILRTTLQHYPGPDLRETLIQTGQLKDLLHDQINGSSTIYWPGHLYQIWIDLNQASYYSSQQASPIIFSEALSKEIKIRLDRARAFQLFEARDIENERAIRRITQIYGPIDKDILQPGLADLERLCSEGGPDWVVLSYKIPGASVTELHNAYLYKCERALISNPETGIAAMPSHS